MGNDATARKGGERDFSSYGSKPNVDGGVPGDRARAGSRKRSLAVISMQKVEKSTIEKASRLKRVRASLHASA
jgi:hypothetical protein